MINKEIRWGIIGCGDVTEVKSGPAFSKVQNSRLVAVMRRDAEKAADYAKRHNVPTWYSDASKLINDPAVDAVYIATPPSTHAQYALEVLKAGKPVYLEKPMAMNIDEAKEIAEQASKLNIPLTVAHYRRAQPLFIKIKKLLDEKEIGEIRTITIQFYKKSLTSEEVLKTGNNWRTDPLISGGGLFHDLAPHQLDILSWCFGKAGYVSGRSVNQGGLYEADDMVAATLEFPGKIICTGTWCFSSNEDIDICEIVGTEGKMRFSFFSPSPLLIETGSKTQVFEFENLQHVQQPMIDQVVQYFLGNGENPCPSEAGVETTRVIGVLVS